MKLHYRSVNKRLPARLFSQKNHAETNPSRSSSRLFILERYTFNDVDIVPFVLTSFKLDKSRFFFSNKHFFRINLVCSVKFRVCTDNTSIMSYLPSIKKKTRCTEKESKPSHRNFKNKYTPFTFTHKYKQSVPLAPFFN